MIGTKVPPIVRDLLVLLGGAVITWAAQDAMPILGPWLAQHPPLGPLLGALIAQILLVLTPLTSEYGVGAGRHRADERGSVRVVFAALVAVMAGALIAAATTAAARATAQDPRRVIWLGITSTCYEQGDIIAHYGYQERRGASWDLIGDSWGGALQVRYVGNGAAPGGTWGQVTDTQRSEGYLRADITGRPTWDMVRVVATVDGIAVSSAPAPVSSPCGDVS